MANIRSALCGLVLLGSGCGFVAPSDFERLGTWQAEGVNERNLQLMVVDPAHMRRGVGAATDRGDAAAVAVRAMQEGQRPPLPRGISEVGREGSGGGSGITSRGGFGGSGGTSSGR